MQDFWELDLNPIVEPVFIEHRSFEEFEGLSSDENLQQERDRERFNKAHSTNTARVVSHSTEP